MAYLLAVSIVWAFSFGLIKGRLAGLDSAFISAARLGLALVVFLPFLRLRGLDLRKALALVGIGAVQFGLMYLAYNESFRHLKAHEVALFTLTTPVFVTLFADAFEKTLRLRALAAALLAVAGCTLVTWYGSTTATAATPGSAMVAGFLLVQAANATFALGQLLYRRFRSSNTALADSQVFALLYAGAFAVTLPVALLQSHVDIPALTGSQIATLAYLGVLASGVCFFLWNIGATRVYPGTLAVFNNAKIPLGVACSLIFFNEQANITNLLASAAVMLAAIWLAEGRKKKTAEGLKG